ncbi:MAG TPA: hypothetical protein VM658_19830 [bacterium]|nr:hypothetical protein [bacterium]
MPDKDKDKIGESTWDNPDESTTEMEIIKDVFGTDAAAPAAGDQVFSQDLFSAPAPTAPLIQSRPGIYTPEKSPPGKAVPPRQEPAKGPPAKTPLPPPAPGKKAPAPAPAEPVDEPEAEKKADAIKIVTDDDLRALFDQSSPGLSPADMGLAPEPVEPKSAKAAEKMPPAPKPAPPQKEKTPVPPAAAAPVDEVLPGAEIFSEDVEELDVESVGEAVVPAAQAPAPDVSDEDVIEQIETRAKVGEMTMAPAAKKGDALQKTALALSGLAPIGDDFMSVDELKKLFSNVSILTDWAQEAAERIERIELKLGELAKAKGNK